MSRQAVNYFDTATWPRGWVRVAYLAAWLGCLAFAGARLEHAWNQFNNDDLKPDSRRADGNSGHAEIDFGGQYLLAHLVLSGDGRDLYHRQTQWNHAYAVWPRSGESPAQLSELDGARQHDAEQMMGWVMGADAPEWKAVARSVALTTSGAGNPWGHLAGGAAGPALVTPEVAEAVAKPAVGGPLYPPVQAVLFAPLAMLPCQSAYHLAQVLGVLAALGAGGCVAAASGGRVWWPVAASAALGFTGCRSGLDLAQNQCLTVLVLSAGWLAHCRGRPVLAGVLWGCLAFKPVWAVAFLLVPLTLRSWRFLAAMVATGAAYALITLPVVGVRPWLEWLEVGREASATYLTSGNWIALSRDAGGLWSRALINADEPDPARQWLAGLLAKLTVAGIALVTLVLGAWKTRPNQAQGRAVGFVLLGAYLSCFRFMYYDAFVAFLPVAWLVLARAAEPPDGVEARVGRWRLSGRVASATFALVAGLYLVENALVAWDIAVTAGCNALASTAEDGKSSATPQLLFGTNAATPLDLWLLLALWLWTGLRIGFAPPELEERSTRIGGADERLAD